MDTQKALAQIATEAERGELIFPTTAEMALKVQRALDDPDCSIDLLVKLVRAEPILAARVVALANSVAYNRSGREITEVKSAVSRLGFKALRVLATSVVVKQMQSMAQTPQHRKLAIQLWEHTAHVAALAHVIARRVTHQDPDTAFFAGIVHEVGGFYLISHAASHPGLLEGEHGSLQGWWEEGEIVTGRAVLDKLGVPPEVRKAIEYMWDGYLAMPPQTLGDTLLLADELAPVESPLTVLSGEGSEGVESSIEISLDDETLSGILAESAAEVASLIEAIRA